MKSYLQRLAVRAQGHNLTPSLIPTARSEVIRESENDPFAPALETYESPDAQSPQATTSDAEVTSTPRYSNETVERPVAVAPATRSQHIRRSHADERPAPSVETQPAPPGSEAATRQHETSATVEVPQKSSDKTLVRANPATTQRVGLDEERHLMPSSKAEVRNAREKAFARTREIVDEADADQSSRFAPDVSQQLTPRKEDTVQSTPASSRVIPANVTDEPARSLEPRRVDPVRTDARVPGLSDEPSRTLEPRRADPVRTEARVPGLSDEPATTLEPRAAAVAPAAPIPDEPRLVIGQLRVDVVAAAPAQPREVVRAVTHMVGPGRSSNTGARLSKLRFGLGQM